MKSLQIVFNYDEILTNSLQVRWDCDGQKIRHIERCEGKVHGEGKYWRSNGDLYIHRMYYRGRVIKVDYENNSY